MAAPRQAAQATQAGNVSAQQLWWAPARHVAHAGIGSAQAGGACNAGRQWQRAAVVVGTGKVRRHAGRWSERPMFARGFAISGHRL